MFECETVNLIFLSSVLVEQVVSECASKQTKAHLRRAKLKYVAALEDDVDCRAAHSLDQILFNRPLPAYG